MAGLTTPFTIIFWASFAPVLLWFWLILKEDPHPEPRSLTTLAVLLGVVAIGLSYAGELGIVKLGITSTETPWLYFGLSALIEEGAKFLLIALTIFRLRACDEPVDAMIYMGFCAIGFAAAENFVGFLFSSNLEAELIIVTGILRSLSANFLHLIASVLIGFGYATSRLTNRWLPFIFSAVASISLHFLYNMFITQDSAAVFTVPLLWAAFFVVLKEFNYLKLTHHASAVSAVQ